MVRTVFSVSCVFTSLLVTASNGKSSPSSGFPNYPRPYLPTYHCSGSRDRAPAIHKLTNSMDSLHLIVSGWRPSHTNLLLFSIESIQGDFLYPSPQQDCLHSTNFVKVSET
jgi:hypothetical protein